MRSAVLALCLLAAGVASGDPLADCVVPVPQALRDEALRLTNAWRAQARDCGERGHFAATRPLVWGEALVAVADGQARWLAQDATLSHLGPRGQSLGERARESGYRFGRITENLAHGQIDVESVVAQWGASDHHCANLMDDRVREFALVCRAAVDARPLWVMVLARPR